MSSSVALPIRPIGMTEPGAAAAPALMLKATLAETKKKYPTLIGDRLLVLAAMNLCSQQLEMQKRHQQELDRYQEQVSATVEVISKTISQN